MTVPEGQLLAGVMAPTDPSAFGYTTTPTKMVLWDLAIMEAAKHARSRGVQLAGISITTNVAGRKPLTNPDELIAVQPGPPPLVPPTTLSPQAVEQEVRQGLPSWAATGDVTVTEDVAAQRVVKVQLTLSPLFLATAQAEALSASLRKTQIDVTLAGGDIGRVIVQVVDPATDGPLYASGDDVTVGYMSSWHSPIVPALPTSFSSGNAAVDEQARGALARGADALP